MKRLLYILSALLIFECGAAENLIRNFSFEEESGGKPLHWKKNVAGNLQGVEFKLTSGACPHGMLCGTISSPDPKTSVSNFVAWLQDFDMAKFEPYAPGEEMLLSFNYATDAPGTSLRAYVEGQADGKAFNTIGPTESRYVDWGTYELRFKLPAKKPRFMYVVLQLLTRGVVSFDNVVLTKAPPREPQKTAVEDGAPQEEPKARDKNRKITLDVRFMDMPAKNIYIQGETPRRMTLRAFMGDEKFSGMTAEIKEIHGDKVFAGKYFLAKGGELHAVWDFPELPCGVYRIECSAKILDKICRKSTLFRIETRAKVDAYPVRFRKDNIMVFHGEPFFPLIVCPPFTTREAYQAYQAAGFNTLCPHTGEASGSEPEPFYQLAADYGLNFIEWRNVADGGGLSPRELEDSFGRLRRNATLLPNFLGIMDDEEALRNVSEEYVRKAWEAFYVQAPGYLYWSNQAPRGTIDYLRDFTRSSDVTGVDVYPIPAQLKHSEMPRQTIACVGDYVDHSMQAADQGRPVWMILQAWSWGSPNGTPDAPLPTFDELRFMFYNAITHGATGIAWFDNRTLDPQNPLMPFLSQINHEFLAISKYITHGRECAAFELEPHSDGVVTMQREWEGKRLLIVVNENPQEVTAKIRNHQNLALLEVGKDEALPNQNLLAVKMPKLGVRIFATDKITYTWAKTFGKLLPPEAAPKPMPLREAIRTRTDGEVIDWRAAFIWDSALEKNQNFSRTTMRSTFDLKGPIQHSWLLVGADNQAKVLLNGKEIATITGWEKVTPIDMTPFLKQGVNAIEIKLTNFNGPGALIYEGEIATDNGVVAIYSSGKDRFLDTNGNPTVKPSIYDSPKSKIWGSVFLKNKRR